MTKRPIAIALTLALAAGLAACSKDDKAAESHKDAGHKAEFKQIDAFDGDATRGERLAADVNLSGNGQSCATCHGADGAKPNASDRPILAGQYQDYLFHAIRAYANGDRQHAQMSGQIKDAVKAGKLDEQGMADLAAYFASQPGPLGDLHGH